MSVFEQKGQQLLWRYHGETVVVEPWQDNSIRVRAAMMHDIIDSDFALLPFQGEMDGTIEIGEDKAVLTNGKMKAVIQHHSAQGRCQIRFYNQRDELLFQEIGPQGALNKYAHAFKPIIGGDHRITASFQSNPSEKLYGMGQYQQEVMDLKGCSFELAHRNSQASIPFVLSSEGYGFLWHNPAIGRAGFNKNVTEWVAESSKQLDYWVTAGDTPSEIISAYGKATGTVPMMPEYGLGFWQSRLRYTTQEQLLEVAREYKRRNLPIDVIVADFFHWPHMGDCRFDEEFYPDPAAMTAELKEMGIELMVSFWPQVEWDSENFEEMRQKGYLVKTEHGIDIQMNFNRKNILFFDATNPDARKFVWNKCRENYYDKGARIFWLDEAEPEYGVYDYDNYRYHIGPNIQMGNLFPQLYSRTFYEGMKEAGQEQVVNLVRCAWAGSQRYGALVWSGDIKSNFEDFRKQICAGIHMGISGIPWWTTDIGGFNGGQAENVEFRELLVRWFQYGTFCPVMRIHGERLPFKTVLRENGEVMMGTGSENEVWSFGEEVYEILTVYLRLREALRPYIRSLMQEAHEAGAPVMRSMFYEFPADPICWDLKDQYLFGSDVLVAPVTEYGARCRTVYLPKGAEWTSVYDGAVYDGGRTILADAPLNQIPVFLRDEKLRELVGQIS